MPKIYLAWRGCYSDASVIGAFTDEALAEAVAKAADPEDGHVEEHEIDDPNLVAIATEAATYQPPMPLWEATSDKSSIAVYYVRKGTYLEIEKLVGSVVFDADYAWPTLRVVVFARDEDHATKIAADKFREFAALTGWPAKALK